METDVPDPNPPTVHHEPPLAPPMFYNIPKVPALIAALAKAQGEYLPIVRNKLVVQKLRNKTTGEYTGGEIKFLYAELSTIRDAVTPALAKHGLAFIQPLHEVGDETWVVSILAHEDGAMLVSRTRVWGAPSQKEWGGNITYQRRYSAAPVLGVSAEDDADDNTEGYGSSSRRTSGGDSNDFYPDERPARPAPARKSAAKPAAKPAPGAELPPEKAHITPGQAKYLISKVMGLKLSQEDLVAFFARIDLPDGVISEDMTIEQFNRIKAEAERVRDAR